MGDFFGLPAGDELSYIQEMINAAVGGLYDVDTAVANAAFGGDNFLWGIFGTLWNWMKGVLASLWQYLTDAIHWLFHTFFPDLVRWINEIRTKITQWLQPLIKWIQWERAWLANFWNTVLKPILNFLQAIRQLLVVFRLLGLKWATQLDQDIADIEGKITQGFLQMVAAVNVLANWINFLVGPGGLFAAPLLLLSTLQTLPQLWAALSNLPGVQPGAATIQQQQTDAQSGLWNNARTSVQSDASGPTADQESRFSQIVQLYQADGYTFTG